MQAHDFNAIVEAQLEVCTGMLVKKAGEYANDDDRLHNFKTAAALGRRGKTPREALGGMMLKHTVSIYDMIDSGKSYPLELWDEKITDHINYLILLKAIIVDETFQDSSNDEVGVDPLKSLSDADIQRMANAFGFGPAGRKRFR